MRNALRLKKRPRRLPFFKLGVAVAMTLCAGIAFAQSLYGDVASSRSAPSPCGDEQECRKVKGACESQNDCSDLKLTPGIVLTPQEECYVSNARKHCNRLNKYMAQCFLQGGPHIAGGCWHTSSGIVQETVEIEGKTFWCENGARPIELQACDTLPNDRPKSEGTTQ